MSNANKVTLNVERNLYVIDCGGGYTCLGFTVAQATANAVADRLGRSDLRVSEMEFGTLLGYERYQQACAAWGNSVLRNTTWFAPGTDDKVRRVLERYRQHSPRKLLRIFLGDPQTGRDWMGESDVVGFVGRSSGAMKVPLLIEPGESGGCAILTASIVRIMDADGRELYRVPNYQVPNVSLRPEDYQAPAKQGGGVYTWSAYRDNELHARFESMYEAAEWAEFVTGRLAVRRSDLVAERRAA